MEIIFSAIAELFRPLIALLVEGIFRGVGFLLPRMNEGLDKQDRLIVSRYHENNSHQEPKWEECCECVEFIGLVKSAEAIADSVADEAMYDAWAQYHKRKSHPELTWSDCRDCRDSLEERLGSLEQWKSSLPISFILTTAEDVMSRFHMESSHQEQSWSDCLKCVEYNEWIEIEPSLRISPPRT